MISLKVSREGEEEGKRIDDDREGRRDGVDERARSGLTSKGRKKKRKTKKRYAANQYALRNYT